MGRVRQVLGLLALSHTEKLPVGRSALLLALVRAVGWRAAVPLTAGMILLRVFAKRARKPGYGRRTDRVA
jgi:hypothetical protein